MTAPPPLFLLTPVGASSPIKLTASSLSSLSSRQSIDSPLTTAASVETIFEFYAHHYPNPRLAAEQQRHAAAPEKRKGWLSAWFGRRPPDQALTTTTTTTTTTLFMEQDTAGQDIKETTSDAAAHTTSPSLCGSLQASLDESCIPTEAYSLARFHLASTARAGASVDNTAVTGHHHFQGMTIARSSWELAGSTRLIVTGWGELVELTRSTACHQSTSDREQLLEYFATTATTATWDLSHVRAAHVGPNFLAISWGLPDGVVIFYRRLIIDNPGSRPNDEETTPVVAWQAVAWEGPSHAAYNSLLPGDFCVKDATGRVLAPQWTITDIVPLVVDTATIPAVSLAVSRLAGRIELLPIPPRIFYGPEIPPVAKKKNRKKKSVITHYSDGLVPLSSLLAPESVVTITTTEYHSDIICLEAFRTTVSADTGWDQTAYPHLPPAEYVLAAAGALRGREAVSLWSVSTIFVADDDPSRHHAAVNFRLYAAVAEVLEVGPLGPNVTLFCNDILWNAWRPPRQIQNELSVNSDPDDTASLLPLATLSISAPLVALRFTLVEHSVLAAFLDWNGGVTLLDCGFLERSVAQSLTPNEYELLFHNSNNQEAVVPLAKILADRSQVTNVIQKRTVPTPRSKVSLLPVITDVQWLGTAQQPSSTESPWAHLACVTRTAVHMVPVTDRGISSVWPDYVLPVDQNKISAVKLLVSSLHPTLSLLAATKTTRRSPNEEPESFEEDDSAITFVLSTVKELNHPFYVIQGLAQNGMFDKAVNAARFFKMENAEGVADIVQNCLKHEWKLTSKMDCLVRLSDVAYIVQEALNFDVTDDDTDKIALFQAVHRLALERITRLSPGQSMEESIVTQLQDRLIRLGTYLLLCRHLKVEPSYAKFTTDILSLSMAQLAMEFAESSDFGAASIVCFRHRHETFLGHNIVIERVPLVTRLQLFQHLFPVWTSEQQQSDVTNFVAWTEKNLSLAPWNMLPQYLRQLFDVQVILDEFDENVVLKHQPLLVGLKYDLHKISSCFATRARKLLTISFSLDQTIEFCRVAFLSLRINIEKIESSNVSTEVSYLYKTLVQAEVMERAVVDEPDSALALTDVSILQNLTIHDLVELSFNDVNTEVMFAFRVKNFLFPLVAKLTFSNEESALSTAIYAFCHRRIVEVEGFDSITRLRVIKMCSYVAKLSKSEINIKYRLVKNLELIEKLLEAAIHLTTKTLSKADLSERRELLSVLWSMYEALPIRTTFKTNYSDTSEIRHSATDIMFEKLVSLDILLQWPQPRVKKHLIDNIEDLSFELIVKFICQSFCYQVEFNTIATEKEVKGLLTMLLSDVRELSRLQSMQASSLPTLLMPYLFTPLMRQKHFYLLESLLSQAEQVWGSTDSAIVATLSCIQDAIYEDDFNEKTIVQQEAALQSIKFIKQQFPQHERAVDKVHRCLATARFINTNLIGNSFNKLPLSPISMRDENPIDIIDLLLSQYPTILTKDCRNWEDPTWSCAANSRLRLNSEQGRNSAIEPPQQLPQLSGHTLFHLANLLGLVTASELIAVKCVIIRHSIRSKLYGFAAAICRSMFTDYDVNVLNQNSSAVLAAVALVLNSEYVDIATKTELGSRALCQLFHCRSLKTLLTIEYIVSTIASLEYPKLRNSILTEKLQYVPVHSMKSFYSNILTEYTTDIFDLLSDLQVNLLNCTYDDSLLNALARFAGFWCIKQATHLQLTQTPSISTASASVIFSLAYSLLGHINDKSLASSSLQQLRQILDSQLLESQQAVIPFLNPNMDVVRQLVDRGYSENSALRATIMTKNAGFNAALSWAIAHSSDHTFESPLVFIDSRRGFVDEELGRMMVEMFEKNASTTTDVLQLFREQTPSQISFSSDVAGKESNAPPTLISNCLPLEVNTESHWTKRQTEFNFDDTNQLQNECNNASQLSTNVHTCFNHNGSRSSARELYPDYAAVDREITSREPLNSHSNEKTFQSVENVSNVSPSQSESGVFVAQCALNGVELAREKAGYDNNNNSTKVSTPITSGVDKTTSNILNKHNSNDIESSVGSLPETRRGDINANGSKLEQEGSTLIASPFINSCSQGMSSAASSDVQPNFGAIKTTATTLENTTSPPTTSLLAKVVLQHIEQPAESKTITATGHSTKDISGEEHASSSLMEQNATSSDKLAAHNITTPGKHVEMASLSSLNDFSESFATPDLTMSKEQTNLAKEKDSLSRQHHTSASRSISSSPALSVQSKISHSSNPGSTFKNHSTSALIKPAKIQLNIKVATVQHDANVASLETPIEARSGMPPTPVGNEQTSKLIAVSVSPITGLPIPKRSTLSLLNTPSPSASASPSVSGGKLSLSLRVPSKPISTSYSLSKPKPFSGPKLVVDNNRNSGSRLCVDVAAKKTPLQILSATSESGTPTSGLSRSTLLKRGQTALRSARGADALANNSPADRQRLIEEGRRLLQQTRVSTGTIKAAPTIDTNSTVSSEKPTSITTVTTTVRKGGSDIPLPPVTVSLGMAGANAAITCISNVPSIALSTSEDVAAVQSTFATTKRTQATESSSTHLVDSSEVDDGAWDFEDDV